MEERKWYSTPNVVSSEKEGLKRMIAKGFKIPHNVYVLKGRVSRKKRSKKNFSS